MNRRIVLYLSLPLFLLLLFFCDNDSNTETMLFPSPMDSLFEGVKASGTIEPGHYLPLLHNLNRDDLNFHAQFVKDGCIYNHTDYDQYFEKYYTLVDKEAFAEEDDLGHLGTAALSDGSFIIIYTLSTGGQTPDKSHYFVIINFLGEVEEGPVQFYQHEGHETLKMEVTGLDNGYFVITYQLFNEDDTVCLIYDQTDAGSYHRKISMPKALKFATVARNSGRFAFIYSDFNDGNKGKIRVYDHNGVVVNTTFTFSFLINTDCQIAAEPMDNNRIAIAYLGAPESTDSTTQRTLKLIDFNGTTNEEWVTEFPAVISGVTRIKLAHLKNNSLVITCGSGSFSRFSIFSDKGLAVVEDSDFPSSDNGEDCAIDGLINGDFILFYYENEDYKYEVYDAYGQLVKSETSIHIIETDRGSSDKMMDLCTLKNTDYTVFVLRDLDTYNGYFTLLNRAHLSLQKTDSNEVRLMNLTDEPLDCILSVYDNGETDDKIIH